MSTISKMNLVNHNFMESREGFGTPSEPPPRPSALIASLGVAWLALVLAGTFLMLAYANTPGRAGSPPEKWPLSSQLARDHNQPALVVFIHPHCPCSRASVGELASLMAHWPGKVKASVLFLHPPGTPTGWHLTDLWEAATRIPGVAVRADEDGREAKLFHIETSGDTVLYDASGRLKYHGGITLSRGHSGDNPGRDSLEARLLGWAGQPVTAPAFGCSLLAPAAKPNR